MFPEQVVGVTPEEFILRTALPRPRDIIHLVRSAVSSAINRGHQRVQPEDLLSAREQYSGYAFDSILKEDDPTKGKLESVLYQFAGPSKIVDRKEIETIFASAGVDECDANYYLDLLCDISFLGIESRDAFRYSINEEERRSLRKVAGVIASREQRYEKFEINPAFYQVLQIEQELPLSLLQSLKVPINLLSRVLTSLRILVCPQVPSDFLQLLEGSTEVLQDFVGDDVGRG